MSKHPFLVTVAATALIAAATMASAQTMNQQPKADAPKADMKADAPKAQDVQKKAQDVQKAPESTQRAPQTTGQAQREGQGGQTQQRQEGQSGQTQQRQEGQTQQRQEGQSGQTQQRQDSQRPAGAQQGQSGSQQGQQGQSGQAGGSAQLSSEQRSRISTVIKTRVSDARVSNVNFSISVGTTVPRTVRFVDLPSEVITIYPAWRGYKFFVVNDQLVVVDPDTLRIVAVLPV